MRHLNKKSVAAAPIGPDFAAFLRFCKGCGCMGITGVHFWTAKNAISFRACDCAVALSRPHTHNTRARALRWISQFISRSAFIPYTADCVLLFCSIRCWWCSTKQELIWCEDLRPQKEACTEYILDWVYTECQDVVLKTIIIVWNGKIICLRPLIFLCHGQNGSSYPMICKCK